MAPNGVPLIRIAIATELESVELEVDGRHCTATPRGRPAVVRRVVGVERVSADPAKIEAALAGWRIRGATDPQVVLRGALYAFGGDVVDTRRRWVATAAGDGPSLDVVEQLPAGSVALDCADGEAQVWRLSNARYRGRVWMGGLLIALGRQGRLAVIHEVSAETALEAVVPAETFPAAPAAALRAQAVAARTQLLAKLGARHITDPFHLCAETHCQAYRPGKAHPATTAAVQATRGEVLSRGASLVDTVYSSSCGGFPAQPEEVFRRGPGVVDGPEPDLDSPPRPWCAGPRFGETKYRWKRPIAAISKVERGASGRVVAAEVNGRLVRGQLPVRRALGGLPSALFVVRDGQAHGAGYGHGAGMCQIGAIGQAEAGREHGTILRYYYGEETELRRLW